MNKYKIEHKIETLAQNAVMTMEVPGSFVIDGTIFSHYEFSHTKGWLHDSWIAAAIIEALNFKEASHLFWQRLFKIVPRATFISQCYTEFVTQPYIICKVGANSAFFRFVRDSQPVGLMFAEDELRALNLLLNRNDIPEQFYRYWNDAVNATGYTPKLLLMFSAIEALAKSGPGKKDWDKIKSILGTDLTIGLFGTKENPKTGLRHRLVHGEYFNSGDTGKNYVDIVHKRLISYFNDKIFKEQLLEVNVTEPQRHLFGNKQEMRSFIQPFEGAELSLKLVLADFEANDLSKMKQYRLLDVSDESLY